MCKREVIDAIMRLNPTAKPAFLAEFCLDDLEDYLRHLRAALTPRPLACLYGSTSAHSRLRVHQPQELSHEMGDIECPQGAMLF